MTSSLPCPACAALVLDHFDHIERHVLWHAETDQRQPDYLRAGFHEMRDLSRLADDAPTMKLPPIGETVRRRPPVPNVRELDPGTPAMLRALADAMDADGLDVEDLADEDGRPLICERCAHPRHPMGLCPVPYPHANARPGENCGCLVGPA